MSVSRLILGSLLIVVVPGVQADIDTYSIGVDGQFSWDSQGQIEAAVDFTDNYVQPS